ncbi:MAG: CapA family protein, partial [Candidatus Poribacteria bacterium]|nr:CapA family protein [Candidatus Poribacteria bacterium]
SVIRDDVANARENADVVIVFVHWGATPGESVDGKQRLVAQTAIDAGATAVFGLRDQVWQGAEVYNGKPIFYSLPDFVRGTDAKEFGEVIVPTVVFDGGTPLRVEFSAVRVDAALKFGDDPSPRWQPRLLDGDDTQPAIEAFALRCAELGTTLNPTDSGVVLELQSTTTESPPPEGED